MSCSYYLLCISCERAVKALRKVQNYKVADSIEECSRFQLDNFGDSTMLDTAKLDAWIDTHKKHGALQFEIQC